MRIVQTISDTLIRIAYEPLKTREQSLISLKNEIIDVGVPEMNDEKYNLLIDIIEDLISETKTEISLMKDVELPEPVKRATVQTSTPSDDEVSVLPKKPLARKKKMKSEAISTEDLTFIDDVLNLF